MKRKSLDDRQLELDFMGPAKPAATIHEALPPSWEKCLPDGIADAPLATVAAERRCGTTVFPPAGQLFRALELLPPEEVKAVILGQDPYHEPGQAMGLAFAVPPECVRLPPSLRNILKEYADDWGKPPPAHPDLTRWSQQGVLLLNTILSVRAHAALSHQDIGWGRVTDEILLALSRLPHRIVFVLWGAPAQAKRPLIDKAPHAVLTAPHPSPLSAYRGFFGSRPFTTVNRLLAEAHRPPIDWTL